MKRQEVPQKGLPRVVAPLLVALHLVEEVDLLLQATVHRLARPRVLARLLLVRQFQF